MDDRFVTLASLVIVPALASARVEVPVTAPHVDATARAARPALDVARADIAQELALLRIAALESFERASADLLARLAHDVLARELALAPVNVSALAARALATFADFEPLALVVAPADVAAFQTTIPVRADPALSAGDLIVEVADGAFESRFDMRVCASIDATAAEAAR